ncbi:hypothetical protein [Pandoraea vervacti]|nr:hypothetical protein [Pandoraea vervacti]
MQTLQACLQTCSPGAAELTRAIERVEAAFTKHEAWQCIKRCFERHVGRSAFVKDVVRNHVTTTSTGLAHVHRVVGNLQLDNFATQLVRAMRPEVRADIVDRWSQPDGTGLYVTEGNFIAVGIPGTDLRLSLMDGGFSHQGLNLSQAEATQLLLARPEGTPPGTTLLDLLPMLTDDRPLASFRIIGAAIGDDGHVLPGLDRDATHAAAAAAHDALTHLSGTLPEREALARFFGSQGDERRAAQSREIIAQIRSGMSPDENFRSGEVARERLETIDAIRRFNDLRAGENRQRAAFHYARAASPQLAAEQYLASAKMYASAADHRMAASMYANAAEKLASFATFRDISQVLTDAITAYENDVSAVSRIGTRCAEALTKQGLYVSAAMAHDLVTHRLLDWLEKQPAGVDMAQVRARYAAHTEAMFECFAAVGLSVTEFDTPSLIRSAIDARRNDLASSDGLAGNRYVIHFDDESDTISAQAFDAHAPTTWVLLRRGDIGDPKQVYELMTEDSMHDLLRHRSVHPYHRKPLVETDFVEGIEVLDMLTAKPPGPDAAAPARASV